MIEVNEGRLLMHLKETSFLSKQWGPSQKVRKAGLNPFALRMAEEHLKRPPNKGWAAMIRKVYGVDPMLCPKCGDTIKIVAFITDHGAVDRIIDHLKLTFIAEKPPPLHVFEQAALMAAEDGTDYF